MPRSHYVVPYLAGDPRLPDGVPAGRLFRGVVRPDQSECLVVSASEIAGLTALTEQQIDDTATAWGFSRAALDAASVPGETGGAEPLADDDFSGYATVNAMLEAYSTPTFWTINPDNVTFEADGFGTSEQCLRCFFPETLDSAENRCGNTSAGITIDLRPLVAQNADLGHLWVELWYRFSPAWTSSWPTNTTAANEDWQGRDNWACATPTPDYKLLFLDRNNGQVSFRHGHTNNMTYKFDWTSGGNIGANHSAPNAHLEYDGEWHRVRVMAKHSSGAGVADARLIGWTENDAVGSPAVDENGTEDDDNHFYGIALGRNRNHRAFVDMWCEFGKFTVWNERPSWDTYTSY